MTLAFHADDRGLIPGKTVVVLLNDGIGICEGTREKERRYTRG